MEHQVRRAQADDADDISRIVVGALRETNARDYTPEIIARLVLNFTPLAVEQQIDQRDVFVALLDGRLVGTASLDGQAVRTVFVLPDMQGRGIGRLLMLAVETTARARRIETLHLSSSVTAEGFYSRLGYKIVREAFYGDERTILMERTLASAAGRSHGDCPSK